MASHHSRSPSWNLPKSTSNENGLSNYGSRTSNGAGNAPPLRRRSSVIQSAPVVEPKLALHSSVPHSQPMSIPLGHLQNPTGLDDLSETGAPPSPSTLTDIILTLHASLYGAKRSVEEIRETVWRYYDGDAVFDSPMVSVHGRRRIIDQFVLAFAFPGLDIRSELRDVICSDFEFDGTRAGIIDHTITVSFLPNLFGSRFDHDSLAASTPGAPMSHGMVTPHPFANYATPTTSEGGSALHRSRSGHGFAMSPAAPSTPFMARTNSNSSRWGSRPLTPGIPESNEEKVYGDSPVTDQSNQGQEGSADDYTSLPRSAEPEQIDTANLSGSGSRDSLGTPMLLDTRPAMPIDAGMPHWSAQGLGRNSFWMLFFNLISPRRTLRSLFSIELRLLSRLEFNEAGRIVRHEDSWSLRELVDGVFPILSLGMSLRH